MHKECPAVASSQSPMPVQKRTEIPQVGRASAADGARCAGLSPLPATCSGRERWSRARGASAMGLMRASRVRHRPQPSVRALAAQGQPATLVHIAAPTPCSSTFGAIAQLGERVVRNDEVRSSILLGSTTFPPSSRTPAQKKATLSGGFFCGRCSGDHHRHDWPQSVRSGSDRHRLVNRIRPDGGNLQQRPGRAGRFPTALLPILERTH